MSRRETEGFDFDTRLLRCIVTIVEEKSLSRAAEKLYLSQPALSRALRGVETELGVPLFAREHNTLRLTNAGKLFVNGARSILHIEQEMNEAVAACASHRPDSVTAAVPRVLATCVRRFVQPDMEAQLGEGALCVTQADPDEALRALRDGEADAALVFVPPGQELPPRAQEILRFELVFCEAQTPGAPLASSDPFLRAMSRAYAPGAQDVSCTADLPVLAELLALGRGGLMVPRAAVPQSAQARVRAFDPPLVCRCAAVCGEDALPAASVFVRCAASRAAELGGRALLAG